MTTKWSAETSHDLLLLLNTYNEIVHGLSMINFVILTGFNRLQKSSNTAEIARCQRAWAINWERILDKQLVILNDSLS